MKSAIIIWDPLVEWSNGAADASNEIPLKGLEAPKRPRKGHEKVVETPSSASSTSASILLMFLNPSLLLNRCCFCFCFCYGRCSWHLQPGRHKYQQYYHSV